MNLDCIAVDYGGLADNVRCRSGPWRERQHHDERDRAFAQESVFRVAPGPFRASEGFASGRKRLDAGRRVR